VILSAPERQHLRREVDRCRRQKIGRYASLENAMLSAPEAASLLGIKAPILRRMIRDLGIERIARHGATMIRVEDLDRLRAAKD
jgi:hypothetical protein